MPCKTLHLLVILQLALLPSLFSQTSEQLRANLYAFNSDGSVSLNDGNLTMYSINNSNAIDGMDAVKMTNFGENFGLLRGSTTLVIERRQHITTSDTTFFRMWNMRQKNYKLELVLTGMDYNGLIGILEDKYLNTQTALNLSGINTTLFTITTDAASWAQDRFSIIFSMPALSFKALPVTFTGIKAYEKNNNIDVEWAVENEKDILRYRIERSINAQQFSAVETIDSKDKNLLNYKWTDMSFAAGNNFYRIASIDIHGRVEYSSIIKVTTGSVAPLISVYPNPVVNGVVNLQLTNQPKGIYSIKLFNNFGQMLFFATVKHEGGSGTQTVRINKNICTGNYHMEIITPLQNKIDTKLLLQ